MLLQVRKNQVEFLLTLVRLGQVAKNKLNFDFLSDLHAYLGKYGIYCIII